MLMPEIKYPAIIMLVGVNGVGKTTTVGKLANYFLSSFSSKTSFKRSATNCLSLILSCLASARISSTISSAVVTETSNGKRRHSFRCNYGREGRFKGSFS